MIACYKGKYEIAKMLGNAGMNALSSLLPISFLILHQEPKCTYETDKEPQLYTKLLTLEMSIAYACY
jgi:hypothetical protein